MNLARSVFHTRHFCVSTTSIISKHGTLQYHEKVLNDINLMFMKQKRFYHELNYSSKGDPRQVLRYHRNHCEARNVDFDYSLMYLKRTDKRLNDEAFVRVKMWYAPLNPADINKIEGVYPSPYLLSNSPCLESYENFSKSVLDDQLTNENKTREIKVGGSEGIGIVTHTSRVSQRLSIGDIVTITSPSMGTWRSSLMAPESAFVKLGRHCNDTNVSYIHNKVEESTNIEWHNLAPLPQVGGTAYRLLHDFSMEEPIRRGEVLIQNGGASNVGIMISQLAHVLFGAKVVSIVRRGTQRTDAQWRQLCNYLMSVGKCAYVFQEEKLLEEDTKKTATKQLQSIIRDLTSTADNKQRSKDKILPRLGFNCIGGLSASVVSRNLSNGGTMVTYGGMSKQNVGVPSGMFIFKDLKFHGYWHSRWNIQSTLNGKQKMLDTLFELAFSKNHSKRIECPKVKLFNLEEHEEAFKFQFTTNTCESQNANHFIKQKVVFDCREMH